MNDPFKPTPDDNEWHYHGDMNVKEGGFWFKESGYDDHVYYVELIGHDNFGGAANEFTVHRGSIYLGDKDIERIKTKWTGQPDTERSRYDVIFEQFAYAGGDTDYTTCLRIGKDKRDQFDNSRDVDDVLHWNTNLRRYIENEFLD